MEVKEMEIKINPIPNHIENTEPQAVAEIVKAKLNQSIAEGIGCFLLLAGIGIIILCIGLAIKLANS